MSVYTIVRFGNVTGTWHQTVLDVDSLKLAEKAANKSVDERTAELWPWVYVAVNNKIVANIHGPDLRGSSCAFAHDYFQIYKPVYLDESLGDSI